MKAHINEIVQHGKTAKGKKELLKHLAGGKLTPKQAIHAKCFDCSGYFADGKHDCQMPKCSLYPYMTFKANKQTSHNSQNMASFTLEVAK